MRIANQLFDRSSLNVGKKDAKAAADKQATAGTATSVPKKVIDLYPSIKPEKKKDLRLKRNSSSPQSPRTKRLRILSVDNKKKSPQVFAPSLRIALFFCFSFSEIEISESKLFFFVDIRKVNLVKMSPRRQRKLNSMLIRIPISSSISVSIDRLLKSENSLNCIESRRKSCKRKKALFSVERVSEMVPPRPNYPVKVNSAEKAVDDYHQQIKNVSSLILDEYRKVCGDETSSDETLPNDQK